MPIDKTNMQINAYRARFNKVLDYIEQHLDEPLLLKQLSKVAHFSPYHFHRQFSAFCGIPPGRYIQLMRLKRATHRLAFNPHEKVIDIALDAGFQHAELFARAFKQVFKVTPGEFRQKPVWSIWYQCIPQFPRKRRVNMSVKIVEFPATPVAMLMHRGEPQRIYETVERFIKWRKTSGFSPVRSSQTYGIAPLDPSTVQPEEFMFQICGSVKESIPENNAFGVVNTLIPAGRCAMLRHHGSRDALTELAHSLYADWLPASGESLRNFPLYFHYYNFEHEVPEHELLTDIYLPLL